MKISMLWKFYFWPIVWLSIFIPVLAYPILLDGIWLIGSRIIGAIFLILSMFLASSGGRTLAKFAHKDEHKVFWPDKFSTFGIFSCMRHPMHLGLAIFPVAIALLSGYILVIATSGWGVVAALWFVIYVEEKDAMEKYGKLYSDYIKNVPPFSIKISCIKKALNIWKT